MNSACQKEWEQLESSLEAFGNLLRKYSHEQLNKPPKEGGWTALQCLHHLMLAEAASQAYVAKKIQAGRDQIPKSGLREWFNSKKLTFFMLLPIKIKAPSYIDTEQLPGQSELEPTLQAWMAQRANLKAYLNSLDDAAFELEIFKHPIAGKLKISSMLAFFHDHFQRHKAQALRAVAAA